MTRLFGAVLLTIVFAGTTGCGTRLDPSTDEKALLDGRAKTVTDRLASAPAEEGPDLEPVAKWLLPAGLREISGIALTTDGRLLAHNDERGRVYVIDARRGVILKQFSIGQAAVLADFEAIATLGSRIFLLTSNGRIYEFREGDANSKVPYTMRDTQLGKECEFEGLDVEPATGAFILVCKVIDKKSERNQVRIYRWLERGGAAPEVTSINIPLADAVAGNDWKELAPSDIAIDPTTGNYLVITGREKAFIEITPQGRVVQSFPLPGNPQQPEGVVVTSDGVLIISDEGVSRPADITLYPWRRGSSTAAVPTVVDSANAGDSATIK